MKRSHAVLVIAECLIEPHYPEDPEQEADYILRRLEQQGMKPPDYLRDGIDPLTDEHCAIRVKNTWEYED